MANPDIQFYLEDLQHVPLNGNTIELIPVSGSNNDSSSNSPLAISGSAIILSDYIPKFIWSGAVLLEDVQAPQNYRVDIHGPKRLTSFYIAVPTASGTINGNTLII